MVHAFAGVPLIAALLAAAPPPPDPQALLARFDEVMAPVAYDAKVRMTAFRDDGTTRSYKLRVLKSGDDKVRVTFSEPKNAVGQEMLRQGDNLWVYMPALRRAVRLASRESFMGGDFNNADVLRVHWQSDYKAALKATPTENGVALVQLELTAKSTDASWDKILLWMTDGPAAKSQPVRSEFYASSGKLLRAVTYADVKAMSGKERPGRIEMTNALAPARRSVMEWEDLVIKGDIDAQRFTLDDLGH